MRDRIAALVFALAVPVAGCGDDGPPPDDDGSVVSIVSSIDRPWVFNRDLDILFVIDTSPSMLPKQGALRSSFPRIAAALAAEGGLPNLHVGIATADLERDGGRLVVGDRAAPPVGNCGIRATATVPGGNFLEDVAERNGDLRRNYNGDLAAAFDCAAALGNTGSDFGQPLEAMLRALGTEPANAGFLREGAYLAVVLVTDEDDCSARPSLFDPDDPALGPLTTFRCFEHGVTCDQGGQTPGPRTGCRASEDDPHFERVETFVERLHSLKPDPTQISVVAIVGVPPSDGSAGVIVGDPSPPATPVVAPSCSDPGAGDAAPAFRLQAFTDGLISGATSSICTEDVSEPVADLADLIKIPLGLPCLPGELFDRDPAMPGVQPVCVVSDVRFPNTPQQTEILVPPCGEDNQPVPCWRSEPNDHCFEPSQLEFIVERGRATVPTDTIVRSQCLVR